MGESRLFGIRSEKSAFERPMTSHDDYPQLDQCAPTGKSSYRINLLAWQPGRQLGGLLSCPARVDRSRLSITRSTANTESCVPETPEAWRKHRDSVQDMGSRYTSHRARPPIDRIGKRWAQWAQKTTRVSGGREDISRDRSRQRQRTIRICLQVNLKASTPSPTHIVASLQCCET